MKIIMDQQKKQIFWNIVNSLLAGVLVILGSCASGGLTWNGLGLAVVAGLTVAVTKFKSFWEKEEGDYTKIFSFVA